MRTGISFWFGFQIPERERFQLISSAGFDNVFFWWGDQFQEDSETPKEKLPELAQNAGLYVENVHVDYEPVNLFWSDNLDGEDIVKKYILNIDDCHNYQIPAMVLHLNSGKNPPPPNELGLNRIKRLAERAEQKNIDIALENLRTVEHLNFVFDRINSDKLKFCYDSGHENCFTKTGDLLDKHGKKLIALHLHDNDGSEDQHKLPGKGTVNWDKIALQLKRNNYRDSVTLEPANDSADLSAEQFLSEAYKKAKEIAEKCE